jgi:hypothetical protein
MDPSYVSYLWRFLLPGYFFTISIETPVLFLGLSERHSAWTRVFAGFWLTACTYPVVILVLPLLIDPSEHQGWYLLAAEGFAHLGECMLFWLAFGKREEFGRASMWQDLAVVFLANSASFVIGEWYHLAARLWPALRLGGLLS